MLNLLIKYAKRVLTLLIIAALFTTAGYCYEQKNQYIKYTIVEENIEVMNNRACEVVVRVGEYNNKPGKRIYLNEVDINILSYSTLDSSVSKFWTISENLKTGNLLKRYSFKRKGWFAISISRNDERYEDISDVNQWRIRYGCANTALVE